MHWFIPSRAGACCFSRKGARDAARIIVSDNGRGIAPAAQARVFDRFQRTVEGRSEEQAAIGLGLPLARQFVEAHGGTIQLQSTEGEGTTVTIRLPRTAEQRADYAMARVAE
jgi:signal transduction histidine kinase